VEAGHDEIPNQNGRARSIRLVTTAASFAQLIGPADGQ
jgi:hypothetical protein